MMGVGFRFAREKRFPVRISYYRLQILLELMHSGALGFDDFYGTTVPWKNPSCLYEWQQIMHPDVKSL